MRTDELQKEEDKIRRIEEKVLSLKKEMKDFESDLDRVLSLL